MPFETSSKNEEPAVINPIEVVRQAKPIAIPIVIVPTLPNIFFDIIKSSCVFVTSTGAKSLVCAPISVKPPYTNASPIAATIPALAVILTKSFSL